MSVEVTMANRGRSLVLRMAPENVASTTFMHR